MLLDAAATTRVDTTPGHARCGRYPGWAVIHTHPQAERWACDGLNRAGYRTFLPTYAARRRDPVLRTVTRIVELPLFTSYAFVLLDQHDPWVPIRYTPGVHSLLMSGGQPNIAARAAVEALRGSEALRRSITPPSASWAPGTACSLRAHAFTGHPAVVLSVERNTAKIALLLFGELRTVSIDVGFLVQRDES